MLEFQLFRIKIYPSDQMLLTGEKKPSEILMETIDSQPSAELRKGVIWHLGNFWKIDRNGVYFRVGKSTKAKRAIFQNGNFLDEEFEEAPYTHVVLDIPIEICAIAKQTHLSPNPKGIANQLARLFTNSEIGKYYGAEFEFDWLKNPEDLIAHIKRAYSISRFWITFSRPNPFDVEDFTKPFSQLVKEVDGRKGKAQVDGENLKTKILEDLTHSAAATGNDAAARIQLEEKEKPATMHLRENPVFIRQDDVSDEKQRRILLQKLRRTYEKIRGKSSNE